MLKMILPLLTDVLGLNVGMNKIAFIMQILQPLKDLLGNYLD